MNKKNWNLDHVLYNFKTYIFNGHDLLQENKYIIIFAMRSNFKLNMAKENKEN